MQNTQAAVSSTGMDSDSLPKPTKTKRRDKSSSKSDKGPKAKARKTSVDPTPIAPKPLIAPAKFLPEHEIKEETEGPDYSQFSPPVAMRSKARSTSHAQKERKERLSHDSDSLGSPRIRVKPELDPAVEERILETIRRVSTLSDDEPETPKSVDPEPERVVVAAPPPVEPTPPPKIPLPARVETRVPSVEEPKLKRKVETRRSVPWTSRSRKGKRKLSTSTGALTALKSEVSVFRELSG